MKKRLMRPAAALFPLTLLAARLISASVLPGLILVYYFALQLLSLCAVDAFRNAAAREPGPRKADKRFFASILPMLIAPALLTIAPANLPTNAPSHISMDHVLAVGAAWLVLVEHLFEERLYTLHRSADGSMLSMISNALLFTGLMLDASGGVHAEYELFFTLIAAAAGAMISVIASFAIQKPRGFTLMPKNLLFAPKAMVQTLLYPAAALAIGLFMPGEDMGQICGFYAGLLLWRLSRTVCRRTDAESRPMNFMLIAPCAILAAAACFLLPAHDAALMCLAAALCAVAVFARIGVRNVSGIVLVAAAIAMQKMNLHWAASVICAVAAVVINSHRAFMKRV